MHVWKKQRRSRGLAGWEERKWQGRIWRVEVQDINHKQREKMAKRVLHTGALVGSGGRRAEEERGKGPKQRAWQNKGRKL